ncbi:ROK family transcriptional regulator [Mesorhizobium sp. BAC0120]|uniref:ROK family transcriptional regulator n=1 Tax=Mesorhizobium sp. BAC0120 TaxID=3090670 RepID=UPI00298C3329|nr:ROK family transcriptional regulator [Mesorhizobium sp. BAC0120]MDW6022452.1 ROK family transcriptional regulator [Mesorhizobium sp. BAC0120]
MRTSDIRRYHANEIFHRIRIEPQISQKEIIRRTGFDKSTVSSIVTRFDELGLVVRTPTAAGNRPGRPAEGLSISPDSGLLVGVQVESEELGFVAAGLDGRPLAHHRQSFNRKVKTLDRAVADGIAAVTAASGRTSPLLGVGISLPGLVSTEGMLVHAPILGWRDVPVLDLLSRIVSAPLYIGNDVKAAAMAEHMFGNCIDLDDFIYLFSGSGVGGALFLDGEIYLGAHGLAGELGHMKVVPQGRLCSCGAAGCLSAYLSEPALAAEVEARGGKTVRSFDTLLDRAEAGDPAVVSVFEQAGEILGAAVSNLVNIFNPPVVALGGDMARASRYLGQSLERSLGRLAHPNMAAQTRVIFSEIATDRPYLGGVALALDGVTGLDASSVIP